MEEGAGKRSGGLLQRSSGLVELFTVYINEGARYEWIVEVAGQKLEKEEGAAVIPPFIPRYRQLLLELIGMQREELARMRRQNDFPDELLRSEEFELDLEEARMRWKVLSS